MRLAKYLPKLGGDITDIFICSYKIYIYILFICWNERSCIDIFEW